MQNAKATPTTREELENHKRELYSQLRADITAARENNVLEQIKQTEQKLKELAKTQLLKNVNATQEKLRATALKVWNAEKPTEDISNNDGSLHATKSKKYPKLASLSTYTRLTYRDGHLYEIKVDGYTFYMHRTKDEHGQPTQYTRPETFEDFLNLNGIMIKPLTMAQYNKILSQVDKMNKEFEKAQEKLSKQQKEIKAHYYSNIKLLGYRNAGHTYTFTPNH